MTEDFCLVPTIHQQQFQKGEVKEPGTVMTTHRGTNAATFQT